MKVYELAKELNKTSSELKNILSGLKIDKYHHNCKLNDDEILNIRKYISLLNKNQDLKTQIKIKISTLNSINDLCELLNVITSNKYEKNAKKIKPKQISYYAYYAKNKFNKFEIDKKSGGKREIYTPNKSLKYILQALNEVFQVVYKKKMVEHGFLKQRSIVTNAKIHINQNYVFNIDLENFFPSIHQARVWKIFQLPPFNLNQDIANLLANLVCFQHDNRDKKNFLPQGAPSSPILSNFICRNLDRKLFKLSKEFKVFYTRYADDLTFSSNHNVYNGEFLEKLQEIIKSENFSINPKKTRLQEKHYRQIVTGICVNKKLNVPRKYIKNLRGLLYIVEKFGIQKAQENENFLLKNKGSNIELVIYGKLQYLKMVKGQNDSTYKKLLERYESVFGKEEKQNTEKNKTNTKEQKAHNPRELVRILNKFSSQESPFKASVHSEEEYYKYGSYENFIKELRKEWKKEGGNLKLYSYKLYGKIYAFLLEAKLGQRKNKNNNYSWGDGIEFGWSSVELKNWCLEDEKRNPFEFLLPERYKKKSINTFYDICMKVFKNEIEIRSEIEHLNQIFLDLAENLGEDFNVEISKNLKGVDFYTDVTHFKKALGVIFNQMRDISKGKLPNININLEKFDDYIEIYIIHENSVCNKDIKTMQNEIKDGDFNTIYDKLYGLCDWSIETKFKDGNFRINYLKDDDMKAFEKIDTKLDGFKQILRFYK